MRLHRLDLNRLIALDALLTECSVSRAAQRLHLSQPAMSAALAALREHFEDPLLIPAGALMKPTEFAQTLGPPVRACLLQAQAIAQRRPVRDLAQLQRRINVVASDASAAFLLAQLMQHAGALAPGLSFNLLPITARLTEQLEGGEVDLMVGAQEAVSAHHPWEPLCETPFACLVWEGHPACAHGVLDREAFFAAGHIVVNWAPGRIELADSTAARLDGATRRVEVQVPTFSMIPDFLENTLRIATLPRPYAEHLAARLALRVLPCPLVIPPLRLAMQWRHYQDEDIALGWVREGLRQRAMALKPGGDTAH